MSIWKQIPNSTRIYLVILVYLIFVLCGLIVLKRWRQSPEGFSISGIFMSQSKSLELTRTFEALSTALTPTFPPDAPWLRAKTNLQIYEGPGKEYPGIAWLENDQTAEIIGVNPGGQWWAIRLPYFAEGSGWVSAEQVEPNNAANVPVLTSGSSTAVAQNTPENGARVRAIANVNIRSGPDLRYQKIGTLLIEKTASVAGVSPDNLWWLIIVPGSEKLKGWISRDYVIAQNTDDVPVISNMSELEATIQAGSPFLTANATINIRSGPDVTFAVIGQLDQNQVAEIVGKTEDGIWWAIRFPDAENERAWVAAAYVEANNAGNVPVLK